MDPTEKREQQLLARIDALEAEVARLQSGRFPAAGDTVHVPAPLRPVFDVAQETVGAYFRAFEADPTQGTIEIAGERYLLIRARSLSYGFLDAVRNLYADRGEAEALHIGKTLLFDMAHVIGMNDARNFHEKMGVTDPVAKLSAGPVHFAYTGWAFVDILPESRPSPDKDYLILYEHPFSFESDSWLRAGQSTDVPVCVMNAGYSSGWCQESFGIPLVATEIACKAKGDDACTFVMAPPDRMREHLERILADAPESTRRTALAEIPALFERKDVEERLRGAVKRAEAASEAKSLFLANMSHEIRTPLTGILGLAHVLLDQDLGERQRRDVERINQSGKALLAILNDILDLSKIEAGQMRISVQPTDVRAVAQEVVDLLRTPAAEKQLSLALDLDETIPASLGTDPLRLRQILLNLAGNAVKFTETGGVRLRGTWQAPATLRFEVQDTGIGIEPDLLPHLFDDFTQADASDARRFGGTGLGLGIAQRLAALLGGEIRAESVPGAGSTFTLTIRAEARAGAPHPTAVMAPPSRVRGRVLLVEDDPIARYVVQTLLRSRGCDVEIATNGREALAAVATNAFDLVLMDCQMPVMDGYDATARIRAQESSGRHIPIVAMTASVMRSDSERCTAAGMDDFLGKPIDPDILQTILARWLEPAPEA